MLMKKNVENFADSGLAIMLMKTQTLILFCHYIIENKGSYWSRDFNFRTCEEKAKEHVRGGIRRFCTVSHSRNAVNPICLEASTFPIREGFRLP
jgi:hypothetical protein